MLDHVSISVAELMRGTAFYASVLAPLDMSVLVQDDKRVGIGGPRPSLWLFEGTPAPGFRVGLRAPSRVAVADFHTRALANGGTSKQPPTDEDTDDNASTFRAVVLDPDGHVLDVFCHGPTRRRRSTVEISVIGADPVSTTIEVDLGPLRDAMDFRSDAQAWWLDAQTGNLVDEPGPHEVGSTPRYRLVPRMTIRDLWNLMAGFASDQPDTVRVRLESALEGEDPIETFTAAVNDEGKLGGVWRQHREMSLHDRVFDWLAEQGLLTLVDDE